MGETNILNYQAKSQTAKSVEDLVGKFDSAKHQWDTYGAALTLSYKKAFEVHEKTLQNVGQKFKAENSELMYFILAAFVAGATGGIAGMLITPILTKAGSYVGRRMVARTNSKVESIRIAYEEKAIPVHVRMRTLDAFEKQKKLEKRVNQVTDVTQKAITEGTKEVGVKAAEKIELEKFFAPEPPKPEGGKDAFKPPETDPHHFDLIKRIEIGICASILKENVRRFQLLADEGELGTQTAQEFRQSNMADSFLADQPTSKVIEEAASETMQKKAELAMWIAWATLRKTEYWKIRLKGVEHIDRGTDINDFYELKKYDPILDRLYYCGVGHLANMPYTVRSDYARMAGGYQGAVLNIPMLKQLGNRHENSFLKRVDNLVRQRRMTVEDFEAITNSEL